MTATHTGTTNQGLIERARRSTAATQFDIESRFQSVFDRGEGAWLYDVEGNRVLDVTAGDWTLVMGHRHPAVTAAFVDEASQHGNIFASTLTRPRIELAETLIERYPCAERVVFGTTGSEANEMAVRLARAATGRDLILSSGYHGWHEWQLASETLNYNPSTAVVGFGYNIEILERMLDEFSEDVAAVLVTPEILYFGIEWHRRMSALCRERGVLFMLDEVSTGFRYGPLGVHGTGEVPADVVVISKGLANGHPVSAVMGREDVIDAYDAARLEGTYPRSTPPMAAALASLELYADGSVHEHCNRIGTMLMTGMREILSSAGVPAWVEGPPMCFDVILESQELGYRIYETAHDFGAYFEPSGTQLVTAAWDEGAVDHALAAFAEGVRRVAEPLAFGSSELPEERKLDAAEELCGAVVRDDESTRALVDETIERVLDRDRALASGGCAWGRAG
jgi:glutamate-1-semialdehyde aminotransferase